MDVLPKYTSRLPYISNPAICNVPYAANSKQKLTLISSTMPETSYGLADPLLLEKIDLLFACNVGEYIDLPQIVVVGDQSSGKSSVLQGSTDLPFPRDSGLCTKFATQIRFRRSQEIRYSIYVIPAQDASEEHKSIVKGWTKADIQSLDANLFANIMAEVRSPWPLRMMY